jgi:hypothetical protein
MKCTLLFAVFALFCVSVSSLRTAQLIGRRVSHGLSKTSLYGVGKEAKRAWAKEDLQGKDMFDDDEGDDLETMKKKQKFKLEPETVFYEGPPSASEVLLPALSVLTVIGIVPFISSLSRQAWVRYKFTSRRISIQSGIGGKEFSELIYPDVDEIKYVYRFGGAGDMVLFLKDGAKVEMRHVPNFDDVLEYVLSKCDEECNKKTMLPIKAKKAAQVAGGETKVPASAE